MHTAAKPLVQSAVDGFRVFIFGKYRDVRQTRLRCRRSPKVTLLLHQRLTSVQVPHAFFEHAPRFRGALATFARTQTKTAGRRTP